jgi:hypothetical protein
VSNPLHASSNGTGTPVLNIVDASPTQYNQDILTGFVVELEGSSAFPSMMALTPNKLSTAVYSSTDYTVIPVDNSTEAVQENSGGSAALKPVTLPGPAQTMQYWTDNSTLFVPVATAIVNGSTPPGALVALNLTSDTTLATIPVPGARYMAQSPDGNRLLVFGDTASTVTLISPIYIGSSTNPVTAVFGNFDHPSYAIFTDSTTAYVLECGPECGGSQARVSLVDLSQTPPVVTSTLNVQAATVGLISGTTLYIAGTPPGTPCPPGTAAVTCGVLSVIDLSSLSVTATAIVTDGFHSIMQMGANAQLFVGAYTCSSIDIAGGEIRGCLSIVNTSTPSAVTTSSVVIPSVDTGDVTGIEPVPERTVVYVCQNGKFRVYDTTTDQLEPQNPPITIVGQPTDVLIVDNPGNYN